MAPRLHVDSGWSDLVFHVLAHVELRGAAASLFHPGYVRWVAQQPPLAGERTLERDARALALVLSEPSAAVAVQTLAMLFADVAQAQAAAALELSELTPVDVASPNALRDLAPARPAAELLRCGALLEAPWHASLPEARPDQPQLEAAFERVTACAPKLAEVEHVFCRALTRHGRVFGERIFLGLPDPEIGVSAEQVAFQAGHEATVLEAARGVRARGFRLGERAVEAVAVVVFAQRCARAGLASEHATWGEQWGVRPEHCMPALLSEPGRLVATELLRR